MNILETFEGMVDDVRGEIAYLTLRSEQTNEIFYGQYNAQQFKDFGIERHFGCKTVRQSDGLVTVEIYPLPEKVISPEELRQIEEKVDKVLAGYVSKDDY